MYTAPAISAGFEAIVYLLIKYIVLVRKDPTRWGLYTAPFFFFTLTAVLTLSISKHALLEHRFITSILPHSLQGCSFARTHQA